MILTSFFSFSFFEEDDIDLIINKRLKSNFVHQLEDLISNLTYHICGGGFCSWPPASLFVRFGEPSPHGFVLKRHEKTLSAVPHISKKNTPLMLYKCLAQACVVVVHSCLCQALIKHEWDTFLADVGLHSKSSHVT